MISQVSNSFWNTSEEGHGGVAIRSGSMKLLVGDPGDDRHLQVPPRSPVPVPFGLSGGLIEPGTSNHAVAPGFQNATKGTGPNCGGKGVDPYDLSHGFCLFDVVKDPNELHDLSGDPSVAGIAEQLLQRIKKASQTAGPIAEMYVESGFDKTQLATAICNQMSTNGGFVEPADALHPFTPSPTPPPSPPGPSPPPGPVPAACAKELVSACVSPTKFESPAECLTCTRDCEAAGHCPHCKPRERHEWCPGSK